MTTTRDEIAHLLDPAHIDIDQVAHNLDLLIADQNQRIKLDRPLSSIPLLWLAIARTVGLTVRIETATAWGAHGLFTQAANAGLSFQPLATSPENRIALIIDGPHNPLMTYSIRAESIVKASNV
ncbi:MAG: hypothetical protein DCC55_22455 [Chloroflexi bacterium]|nr:MAG: hypothetical protein DCC55_22455 [Chloroflexota bacterium]